jgi:hypothetical protein
MNTRGYGSLGWMGLLRKSSSGRVFRLSIDQVGHRFLMKFDLAYLWLSPRLDALLRRVSSSAEPGFRKNQNTTWVTDLAACPRVLKRSLAPRLSRSLDADGTVGLCQTLPADSTQPLFFLLPHVKHGPVYSMGLDSETCQNSGGFPFREWFRLLFPRNEMLPPSSAFKP